ncbi:TetR/AcrR family transcriptional regulator [Gordonia sputi]
MRTHGWSGAAPTDDDDAVERILTAATELIDADELVNVQQVARRLGVTRQTVYRYFDSSTAILQATAERSTAGFLRDLSAAMSGVTNPADAVVEGIATTLELLRANKSFGLLFGDDGLSRFLAEVTSPEAITLGRALLAEFNVDWQAAGWTDDDLDGLVEHMLRTLQSFIADPGHPPRTAQTLRGYLRKWVAPSVAAQHHDAPAGRTR